MPVTLTVNNIPFEYPANGDSPGWGQPATDWATEVTNVLGDLVGPTDILQTTFTVLNNQSISQNVLGLSFNTGLVRAAFIDYSIYRTSTANPSGFTEAGSIVATYDNLASAGSKWQLAVGPMVGNAGVTFTITDGGQFQYQSSDINATGYSGTMHFRATTLGQ